LLASLDDSDTDMEDVEAAWATEIDVLAGESAGIPWEDVRRRADDELRGR
jgi:hypothetical protein